MTGNQILPILLGLALAAGGFLIGKERARKISQRLQNEIPSSPFDSTPVEKENLRLYRILNHLEAHILGKKPPSVSPELLSFVEENLGLNFKKVPELPRFSQAIIEKYTEKWLDQRFPSKELATYSKALELLDLLPKSLALNYSSLHEALITNELAARRYFINDTNGKAYLTADFDENELYHRASLVELLTRLLIFQEFPLPAQVTFDQWLAYRGLTESLSLQLKSLYLAQNAPAPSDDSDELLVDLAENEREAILLGLPLFGHAVAQMATFEVPPYLQKWRSENPEGQLIQTLPEIPFSTYLFYNEAKTNTSVLHCPEIENAPIFSLGAIPLRLLLETKILPDKLASLSGEMSSDRFWIINSPTDGIPPSLLWAISFESSAPANQIAGLLLQETPSKEESLHFKASAQNNILTIFVSPEKSALETLEKLTINLTPLKTS